MVFKILSNPDHSGISQVRAEKLGSKFIYGRKLINLSLGVALGKYFLIASSASLFSPFCILFTFPASHWNSAVITKGLELLRTGFIFLIVIFSLSIFSLKDLFFTHCSHH